MNDAFEAFEAFGRWDNASCLKKCVRNGIYILLPNTPLSMLNVLTPLSVSSMLSVSCVCLSCASI